MIFSIFLIIIFIVAAGIAARTLIGNAEHAEIILFIQELNSEVEKIFGYSKEELLGKKIEILVPSRFHQQHPHDRKEFLNAWHFGFARSAPGCP